ncbi:MAG: hypothetical protein ABTQ73_07645 [Caldilineales bacterium]
MAPWQRPTIDTKFHIDHDWWQTSGRNFRLVLLEQLCEECKQRFVTHRETEIVDWVNPDTGEVSEADALLECLKRSCAQHEDFIDARVPLTAAVFRVFLLNDNSPLSCRELHRLLPWKQPETILTTLSGHTTYLGIRPA